MSTTLVNDRKPEMHNRPIVMKPRPGIGLLFERFTPFAIGVISGAVVLRTPTLWVLQATWHEFFLDKILDIEIGQLAGLFAVVAFLPAIEERTVIRKLKQWGWYRYLINYIREAMFVSALATMLAISCIVWPDTLRGNIHFDQLISSVLWCLILYSVAAAFRIVRLSIKSLLAE